MFALMRRVVTTENGMLTSQTPGARTLPNVRVNSSPLGQPRGPMSREAQSRGTDVRLFGPFRLDVGEQRLWRGNDELKLRRKPFAILRFLTANPLRLVTQEEIVGAVWGGIAMSESLLRTHMSEVRRVLGEGAVETVIGRGYRFLLGVEAEKPASSQRRHVVALPTPA